jgi:hypothetical protein
MGPIQFDHKKRLITLTVITLRSFHRIKIGCEVSLCIPSLSSHFASIVIINCPQNILLIDLKA